MATLDLQLPDELATSDSVAGLLSSFAPVLEDAAVVSDELAVANDQHRLPTDAAEVADEVEVSAVSLAPRPSDELAAPDAVEVLLTVPQVLVTSVTPSRGRTGDTVVIRGTGFDAASNAVRFAGLASSLSAQSTTELTIAVPALLDTFYPAAGRFIPVVVTNNVTGRTFTFSWWFRRALTAIMDDALPPAYPGPREVPLVEDPLRAQSSDWERAATWAELLTQDLLTTEGDLFGADATGVARVPATSVAGRVLYADSTATPGVAWGPQQDVTLCFGGQLLAANVSETPLVANGRKTETTGAGGAESLAPFAGVLDMVSVYQHSAVASADRLVRVQVYVNGSSAYDSGAISVAHLGHYSADPNVTVAAGDRVEVRVTKSGTADTSSLAAHVRLRS